MTDLEAKISSEFANGDPTVQGAVSAKQPLAMRVSLKRIAPIITVMLVVGGGVITYFASSTAQSSDAPAVALPTPTIQQVSSTVTDTPASSVGTAPIAKVTRVNAAKAVTTTPGSAKPTPATNTPTPTPNTPTPTPVNSQKPGIVESLVKSITSGVKSLVDATVSIVL